MLLEIGDVELELEDVLFEQKHFVGVCGGAGVVLLLVLAEGVVVPRDEGGVVHTINY